MAQDPDSTDRVPHILALMKHGDDAFNRRDKAAMDAAHHPEMVAHITGNADPRPRSARCRDGRDVRSVP
jgi:hypothetical protein